MNLNAAALLAPPFHEEVESVLATLSSDGPDVSLRLNDLAGRTGLPTGHVGRHLRTLERDRLALYGSGAWTATERGLRHAAGRAADVLAAEVPAAAQL